MNAKQKGSRDRAMEGAVKKAMERLRMVEAVAARHHFTAEEREKITDLLSTAVERIGSSLTPPAEGFKLS